MVVVNDSIICPAGIYSDVLNYRGSLNITNPINGVPNPRYLNNYYAAEVGKIKETMYWLYNPTTYEKRLVRYNIE